MRYFRITRTPRTESTAPVATFHKALWPGGALADAGVTVPPGMKASLKRTYDAEGFAVTIRELTQSEYLEATATEPAPEADTNVAAQFVTSEGQTLEEAVIAAQQAANAQFAAEIEAVVVAALIWEMTQRLLAPPLKQEDGRPSDAPWTDALRLALGRDSQEEL